MQISELTNKVCRLVVRRTKFYVESSEKKGQGNLIKKTALYFRNDGNRRFKKY